MGFCFNLKSTNQPVPSFSSGQDLKAALSQLQLFQRRLASAEQRLQGEVQWRSVAEARQGASELGSLGGGGDLFGMVKT